MFEQLTLLPNDPILGLMKRFSEDSRADKIDLGVGVYRNAEGATPVMQAVKQAETLILEHELTKSYVGPQGNQQFNHLLSSLILGKPLYNALHERCVLMQTPGGCGALRVAAELIKRTQPDAKIWVSDPTWGNHMPLLGDAGLTLGIYPYYDNHNHGVRFDAMMAFLRDSTQRGDIILLHGSCHNPSGADLSKEQWREVAQVCQEQGLIPFVDSAYQGFGDGLDEDAYGLRYLCEHVDELIFVYSCSKNFGLYRERVGAVAVLSKNAQSKGILESHIQTIVRGIYSMPPSHGAMVVEKILSDDALYTLWHDELVAMRARILDVRTHVVEQFDKQGFGGAMDHLSTGKGMFSFLGLAPAQIELLAVNSGVYMVGSSRMNMAGLTPENINYFVSSVGKLLE